MKIERFEDLLAWQEARKLVAKVYDLTKNPRFQGDRELVRQMRSAALSVMANIAEGFSRFSMKENKQFFMTARSSSEELRSHSYVAEDEGYMTRQEAVLPRQQMEVVGKLLSGLIRNSRLQLEREQLSHSAIERSQQ